MVEMGLPLYRGRQIYRAMYHRRMAGFDEMTDLPTSLREDLEKSFCICRPEMTKHQSSEDGTIKYAFSLDDGHTAEAVYIPDTSSGNSSDAPSRVTLCLSTQVGCPLACTFCFSGTIPFARNLTVGEILGQFVGMMKENRQSPPRVNVVYMGMGEPLLNAKAVLGSLEVLTDSSALAVSPRRVTVSTAGLVKEIESFFREAPKVGLAVSLHATDNDLRGRLMPINRKFPIEKLMEAIRRLPVPRRRKITFEYVLLGGENDSEQHATELALLLRGAKAKINLIAYNPWPGAPHKASTSAATERFKQVLIDKGYTVSLRQSRGADVLAACGQLAGRDVPR
jgi:23S rRNA (adenine2503-C2)-methyltransferase